VTAPTWVVGAGGLLGRHVVTKLAARDHEVVTVKVHWADPDDARAALRRGYAEVLDRAAGGPWNIAWCAGAGVVSSSPDALEQDAALFTDFVRHLAEDPAVCARGAFFLASSAGGVYAGSPSAPPYTEDSEPRPLAAYGWTKLTKEAELAAVARATGMPAFIGRIANLYGPGQNIDKPQGLVSHLCRAHFTGQPLSIYVPLDTLRDYLMVSDCADMVAAGLAGVRDHVRAAGADPVIVKILASGRGTSVGALIAETARVLRKRPRIELVSTPSSALQARDLRLKSVRWPELDRYARTTLPAGIAATAEDIEYRLRLAGRAAR
jgi:UDP-glucose 4-epimerase